MVYGHPVFHYARGEGLPVFGIMRCRLWHARNINSNDCYTASIGTKIITNMMVPYSLIILVYGTSLMHLKMILVVI